MSERKRSVNRRRRKRTLIAVICVAVLAALIALCVLLWKNRSMKAVDVVPVSNVSYSYWGDSLSMEAIVTDGNVQNVALKDSLVQSISVAEGTVVAKGDVLMTYDTTTLQLTLQTDAAKIAVLESQLSAAESDLKTYKSLKPSESAPAPTIITVPGDRTAVTTEEIITSASAPASGSGTEDDPFVYYASQNSAVTGEMLSYLAANGLSARFEVYDGLGLLCTWTVTPEYLSAEESYSDWVLTDGVTLNGDGTASVDMAATHYGIFSSYVPDYDDGSYTYEKENYTIDSKGNYAYTKAELAEMISDKEKEISELEMDLKEANLTYQKDQLVSETGNVTAAIDGTVTFVGDPNALSAGETVITVKGQQNYTLTIYVGEGELEQIQVGSSLSIYSYETSNSFTATVTEVGTQPSEDGYYYGSGNPNSTVYPVTAVADDPDLSLTVGEWCEATLDTAGDEESDGDSFYVETMFVRDDDSGSYVMVADENNQLTKRYVKTGKLLYGSEIEIKSGLTQEDRIAFPYGKTVKEGAPVNDVDYFEY